MFEKAIRLKLRFSSSRGLLTAEDLWDIPLASSGEGFSLDEIAMALSRTLKEDAEESFVIEKTPANVALELSFEIVKYIIKVRLEEQEKRENATVLRSKKKKILEIIASKEDEALASQSVDDLKKMVEDL